MRVERQDETTALLEETLKAAKAAQKAAESAEGYLFWMNVGWYVRMAVTAAVFIGIFLLGWKAISDVRAGLADIARKIPPPTMNLNLNIPVEL